MPTRTEITLPPLIAFLRRTRWYLLALLILASTLPAVESLPLPVRLVVSLLGLAWINASGAYRIWHSFRSGYREPSRTGTPSA